MSFFLSIPHDRCKKYRLIHRVVTCSTTTSEWFSSDKTRQYHWFYYEGRCLSCVRCVSDWFDHEENLMESNRLFDIWLESVTFDLPSRRCSVSVSGTEIAIVLEHPVFIINRVKVISMIIRQILWSDWSSSYSHSIGSCLACIIVITHKNDIWHSDSTEWRHISFSDFYSSKSSSSISF